MTLELPDCGLPVETGRLLEQLQPAFSKAQGQRHALLEGKAEHLFLKLVSEVVGYGMHEEKYIQAHPPDAASIAGHLSATGRSFFRLPRTRSSASGSPRRVVFTTIERGAS